MIPDFRSLAYLNKLARTGDRHLEDAQRRHEDLTPYGDMRALLAELTTVSPASYLHRDAIVRALIHEAQQTRHAVWTDALCVAFQPALAILRGRLKSSCDPEELDQLVCHAFLEAVHSYPLERYDDRTLMRLRQNTHKSVFRSLRRDKARAREHAELLSKSCRTSGVTAFDGPSEPECLNDPSFERVLRHYVEDLAPELVEMLVRTTVGGESVCGYVARVNHGLEAEALGRKYESARRQRSRWLAKVRRRLCDVVRDDSDFHAADCAPV